jgi:hypothetical protein
MTYWSKEFEEACAKADATADNHSSEQKSAEDCAAAQKGQPLSIADFLAKELPERKNIIDPWLPEKGLGMIYSPRGVGKTLFGLGSGYAISAAETFLGFEVEAPQKVLYVDGEMPARVMQERLAAIVRGFGKQPPSENHFRLLCADLFEFGLPDLATPAGQAWFDARIGDTNVIFLDNISTLVRSGKENEAESWRPLQGWLLRQRRLGRSVMFLHHAGKGGAQRGTSNREDVLDTVIGLRPPYDYSPHQGEAIRGAARGAQKRGRLDADGDHGRRAGQGRGGAPRRHVDPGGGGRPGDTPIEGRAIATQGHGGWRVRADQ